MTHNHNSSIMSHESWVMIHITPRIINDSSNPFMLTLDSVSVMSHFSNHKFTMAPWPWVCGPLGLLAMSPNPNSAAGSIRSKPCLPSNAPNVNDNSRIFPKRQTKGIIVSVACVAAWPWPNVPSLYSTTLSECCEATERATRKDERMKIGTTTKV